MGSRLTCIIDNATELCYTPFKSVVYPEKDKVLGYREWRRHIV